VADILSLNVILFDYCHIVHTDKRSGHNAAYYVRNTSIEMKTHVVKTCFYYFFTLFLIELCRNGTFERLNNCKTNGLIKIEVENTYAQIGTKTATRRYLKYIIICNANHSTHIFCSQVEVDMWSR